MLINRTHLLFFFVSKYAPLIEKLSIEALEELSLELVSFQKS